MRGVGVIHLRGVGVMVDGKGGVGSVSEYPWVFKGMEKGGPWRDHDPSLPPGHESHLCFCFGLVTQASGLRV